MKLYSKDQLVDEIKRIFQQGLHRSVKKTKDTRNDGAVGNTLEKLLGIAENNLPIPNAQEWELKGQRLHTSSLLTLKHIEPSPRATRIVPSILLPLYGWRHNKAGLIYPVNEMSFRSTTSATMFTNRGFRILVDRDQKKVRFIFDPTQTDSSNPEIAQWLNSVEDRIGLGPLEPEPYWGLEDLKYSIGSKMRNCLYVVAESSMEDGHEFFRYVKLHILSSFSFEKFVQCLEEGAVLVDFDARTGHNHGTKFRLKQGYWTQLYSEVQEVI